MTGQQPHGQVSLSHPGSGGGGGRGGYGTAGDVREEESEPGGSTCSKIQALCDRALCLVNNMSQPSLAELALARGHVPAVAQPFMHQSPMPQVYVQPQAPPRHEAFAAEAAAAELAELRARTAQAEATLEWLRRTGGEHPRGSARLSVRSEDGGRTARDVANLGIHLAQMGHELRRTNDTVMALVQHLVSGGVPAAASGHGQHPAGMPPGAAATRGGGGGGSDALETERSSWRGAPPAPPRLASAPPGCGGYGCGCGRGCDVGRCGGGYGNGAWAPRGMVPGPCYDAAPPEHWMPNAKGMDPRYDGFPAPPMGSHHYSRADACPQYDAFPAPCKAASPQYEAFSAPRGAGDEPPVRHLFCTRPTRLPGPLPWIGDGE